MSITVSNWKDICDAPTNKSPTKMAYSFSKANRFSSQKANKSPVFYNVEPKITKRATSFGYGHKYDFTRDQPKSPPPTSYDIPTTFCKHSKSAKGFCFGEGRTEMTITGPLAETINNKNPGPGAYEPAQKQLKISYTLRGKIKHPQPEAEKVPGPGSYQENPFFTQNGGVFNSKYASHKAGNFSSGGERFRRNENLSPGPGNYNTSNVEFSRLGKYSLSNLQSSKVRSFGHAVRDTFANRCKTPGPGNYKLPSEFGYYMSRTEHERTRTQSRHDHLEAS